MQNDAFHSKKVRGTFLYYGFQFFFGMLLWVPIFYDFQKKIGLDDSQIFGIQSIYYLAFCLMEIPTGFLADFWGYRVCMNVGATILTAANLIPVFSPTYEGCLVHFLLIALARSLISGASSAYLYDSLRAQGRTDLYKGIEGNARSYGLVGKVVLWLGIGVLMQWRITLPYQLSAVCSAISVGFALSLPAIPTERHRSPSGGAATAGFGRSQVWSQLGTVLGVLVRTPALVMVMIQGIAIFVLARIVSVNLFQPVLSAKSFHVGAYGAVMSGMTIFEAVGSAYPGVLRRWWNDLNAVFVLTVVMGVSVAALAWGGQVSTVFWLCLFSLAAGLSFPIQRQLLNDAIPAQGEASKFRATLLSVESLIDRAVCAGVASVLASSLSEGKMNSFLIFSGCACIFGVVLLLAWAQFRVRILESGLERY